MTARGQDGNLLSDSHTGLKQQKERSCGASCIHRQVFPVQGARDAINAGDAQNCDWRLLKSRKKKMLLMASQEIQLNKQTNKNL